MNSTLEKVFLLNPSFSLLSIWKIVVCKINQFTLIFKLFLKSNDGKRNSRKDLNA